MTIHLSWSCESVYSFTSFEFMRHTITLILCTFIYFVLLYCYNLCSTLTFFQTNVNLIYVPHVLSHWWFELNNVNWIVRHLTQDRHGNSVTCSVGCTTVTLLLQIHYFPFFRFLVEYTFCQKQFFMRTIFLFMSRKKTHFLKTDSVLPLSIVWKC